MTSNPKMTKYYIGVVILAVVSLAALLYTLSQSSAAKTDKATDKALEQISEKLDTSIITKGAIPASLSEAGISNVPPTVTYQRLSDNQYKVCFNYKTASSGFDASWTSLLLGAYGASGQSYDTTSSTGYFNSGIEFNHKKGQNCQTVKPYDYGGSSVQPYVSPSSNNSSGASGSTSSGDCTATPQTGVTGFVTVSGVDLTNKQINFSSKDQYIADESGKQQPDISSKYYDGSTLFCDVGGKPADVSAIKADSSVTIYLDSSSDPILNRVDVLF